MHPFKILLLGDSCIDEYYYGTCDRLNPEAPVPVLNITRSVVKQGMAANVRDNLAAFGCLVTFITTDQLSVKKRYIDERSKQHIVRVDQDAASSPVDIMGVNLSEYAAIVISDYNKGAIDYATIETVRDNYTGPIFVDTKKTDLARLAGCYVKINEKEYAARTSTCNKLIVTLGDRGAQYNNTVYPCAPTEVTDVCGAGDTFLAALTVKYLQSNCMAQAIEFANRCSAITVGHQGVYALTSTDIQGIDHE